MTELDSLIQIHGIGLRLEGAAQPRAGEGLTGPAFGARGIAAVQRARARRVASLDRRWVTFYERARQRYGRGMAAVRERVCLGCYLTLPTRAQPAPGLPMICEGCGRLLYWAQPGD